MIVGVYALFDKVRNQFGSISIDTNNEVAKRGFLFAVSKDTQLQYISKDLELFKIGEMNTDNGIISPLAVHELISRGEEYVD